MKNGNTYEGWANWDTWNVNLWIMNDYGTYQAWVAECREGDGWDAATARGFYLSVFDGSNPDKPDLDAVDWAEIAQAWEGDRAELLDNT